MKLKLRFGLSLQTARLYAKLRFRTEPLSPIDLGEGLTCAGKLPLPIQVVPLVRSLPLRVEYRLRVQTASQAAGGWRKPNHPPEKVAVSTGLGAVDLSLDELNFCLEWDELSPLWVSALPVLVKQGEREESPNRLAFCTCDSRTLAWCGRMPVAEYAAFTPETCFRALHNPDSHSRRAWKGKQALLLGERPVTSNL